MNKIYLYIATIIVNVAMVSCVKDSFSGLCQDSDYVYV